MPDAIFPEVVWYTDSRGARRALVLSSRAGEVSHLGRGGEPLLTLAVKKYPAPNLDRKKPTPIQQALAVPEIEVIHDVVHASHEFTQEFREAKGLRSSADVAAHRGAGEWTCFLATAADEPLATAADDLTDE